jgi:hypothetical protein
MDAADRDPAEVVYVRVCPGLDREWKALRNHSLVGNSVLNQESIACNNEAKIAL